MKKALLLDFGGTLVVEHPSRAAIYAEAGTHAGLRVDESTMAELMHSAHAALPARLGRDVRYTRPWFERFMEVIFCDRLGLAPADLPGVQDELFTRFADPATFRLQPGAHELLAVAHDLGLRTALVSNWSETLDALVRGLGLHFDTVLSSALVRCEKPDARIFELALRTVDARPGTALYAGDSIQNDIDGAAAIGMRAVLVDHDGAHAELSPRAPGGIERVTSLNALSSVVTEWAAGP